MMQKIVIKVQINCDKCRKKAMRLIASTKGVNSIAIQGDGRDRFVLVCNEVDPIRLTSKLRKKVGRADLEKVEQVKDDTTAETSASISAKTNVESGVIPWFPRYPPQVIMHQNPTYSDSCSIL